MNDIKKVKIFTILIHSFIIIGAGHGIGILLFFELPSIPSLIINGFEFNNLTGDYEERLMLVGLISIIGKIILIVSLFIKNQRNRNLIGLLGILMLWISVYFISSGNWNYNSLFELAFWTSTPFLISSIILVTLILKNINQNRKLNI